MLPAEQLKLLFLFVFTLSLHDHSDTLQSLACAVAAVTESRHSGAGASLAAFYKLSALKDRKDNQRVNDT